MADVESLELQITGNTRGATRSLNNLIKTLDKLKEATAGGCGLSAVADGLNRVNNSGGKVSVTNAKTGKSFVNLGAKVAAAYLAIKKGGQIVASWIKESNDYVENLNLFTVAMGDYADSAKQYAEEVGDLMGIDPSDWMRSQGVFMTLATGFGVATDRAATMSQQLTQLGYDISSFYNTSVEDAMTKLQSGISGELEPLRRLGYDLSQAKLEATALSLGIDKAVSSMTQAEKAELRYYAIMTQVTTAQGDMARTLDAPANQMRVLSAQATQAARALGDLFIPALNAILPVAIAVLKVITALAKIIARLFGADVAKENISTSMGDLATSAGSAGSEIDNATSSAKKLKKTLLGIDELNVMPSDSGGSGSDDASGGGFSFDLPTYDFIGDLTETRVAQIVKDMMAWLGITEDINSWSELMDTRFGTILKTVGLIGGALLTWKLTKGFIDGIAALKALLASPSYSIAIGAILTITGFTIAFDGMEDAVKNGLDGVNLGEILFGGLAGAGGAAILGSTLANWISTAFAGSAIDLAITQAGINLGVGTAGAAGAAILGSFAAVIVGIPAFFVGIYDAIQNGLDWLNGLLIPAGATAAGAGIGAIIGMLGGPIGAGIGALIGLAVGLVTDLVILIVQNWDAIATWFSEVFAAIGQWFVDLWNGVVAVWQVVATWFDTNIIQPVAGFFVTLWDGIASAASACWDAIVEFFTPAVEWFAQLFGSIFQCISDIFYNIGVIAVGCWEIIKICWEVVSGWFDENIIQPVSQFFSDMWTGIKDWAIGAWDGIKSVFSTIGNWVNVNIIQPVSGFFSNLWAGFKNGAAKAWEGVKSVFSAVGGFFSEVFSNAWRGIIKVFSIGGEIFVKIKDAIVTAFKFVVNGIITGLNSVIAVPFNGINGILNWLKNIEIAKIKPFSSIKTVTVPQIPKLADGGVVDAGQMFVANEAGPELVGNVGNKTAVVNNDQIVEAVSRGVYKAVVQAMGQSGGSQVVEAKVNDKVLFEVVVDRNRRETMRTGYSPLLGGV